MLVETPLGALAVTETDAVYVPTPQWHFADSARDTVPAETPTCLAMS